jgi:acetyl esterase
MTATNRVVLEPAAQQVADATSKPPFLYDMAPADARKVMEKAQSGPVSKLPVDEEWITIPPRREMSGYASSSRKALPA